MPIHSGAIFKLYLIYSLQFSKVQFVAFQSPGKAIFRQKRKSKIFRFENAMERGIRKILALAKLQIASKIFGRIILRPL